VDTSVISAMHYEAVRPNATYAPWRDDPEFMRVHAALHGHTLVDLYRCFELWELVAQAAHLPGNILEVGVWRGGTGALIAARAMATATGKTVYLCDTFAGVVKATDKDTCYRGGEHADTTEEIVTALMARLELENVRIVKGIFPDDHAHAMEREQFCFVHIDVDVFQSAKDVLDFVWPRMPVGGTVVFDDYGFPTCDGIPKLVNEYRGRPDMLVLHNLNGHAVLVKISA
jgi:O-methyltransferase